MYKQVHNYITPSHLNSLLVRNSEIHNRATGHSNINFTITAEIHARSLADFYCQYADRHMNLKFIRRVSERERAIRQFVIAKNKLMSVCNAPVLLWTTDEFRHNIVKV